MGAEDLILLEGLQRVGSEVGNESSGLALGSHLLGLLVLWVGRGLGLGSALWRWQGDLSARLVGVVPFPLDKTDGVSMNNSVVLTSNPEVVCN